MDCTITAPSSKCANCDKTYADCTLKRCSVCSLRYYCSQDCQKAHWPSHKVECMQALETRKAAGGGVKLDLTHPFECAIAAFATEDFTEASFVGLIKVLTPLYFNDQVTTIFRTDLEGVTEAGYHRLITLAVRALHDFPANVGVVLAAYTVMISYVSKYNYNCKGSFGMEARFQAKELEPIVHCLKEHIANPVMCGRAWFILARIACTARTKQLQVLGSLGVMDLIFESLKLHGRDNDICDQVIGAVSHLIFMASIRRVAIPPYDINTLVLHLVLAMKRFPTDASIQHSCCMTLQGGLIARTTVIDEIQKSSLAASLASLGVYELVVAAIHQFPTADALVSHYGSQVLGYISKQYFADNSKPRNTDACVAIAVFLSLNVSDVESCHAVAFSLPLIFEASPASGVQFLRSGVGLSSLGAALQAHIHDAKIIGNGSDCIYVLCGVCMNKMRAAECALLARELEQSILPVLLQGFKFHLRSTEEGVVFNCMMASMRVANRTKKDYPELTALIREAMRRYPSAKSVQVDGGKYLRSIGL